MTSKLRHFMDDDESTLVKLTRRTRVLFGQTPQGWVDDETFHDIQEAMQALRPMFLELYQPLRRELHQLRSANSRVAGTSTRIQNETDS